MPNGFVRFMVVCFVAVLSTIVVLWYFALNNEIREMILRKILKKKYANAVK